MLAIRLQRTGRKGHAQFRLIVQEARRSPSSGSVVAALGSYDPHTKAIILDKEKAATFLNNGAQPSPRVAVLLQKEGVKLPSWVKLDDKRQSAIKNVEKLRRNRPDEPKEASEAQPSTSSEAESAAEVAPEAAAEPTEAVAETPVEAVEASTEAPETTVEEAAEEAPAEAPEAEAAPEETSEPEVPATEDKAEETPEA